MSDASELTWISKEQVLYIHSEMIRDKGGIFGIRDEGLLESAIARPQNHYAYCERNIFKLAATYAEGLARNHAFVDGNKRTAFTVADIFLRTNGRLLDRESADEQTELFENLAQGKVNREEIADFYCQNTQEIDGHEKGNQKD